MEVVVRMMAPPPLLRPRGVAPGGRQAVLEDIRSMSSSISEDVDWRLWVWLRRAEEGTGMGLEPPLLSPSPSGSGGVNKGADAFEIVLVAAAEAALSVRTEEAVLVTVSPNDQ